MQYVYVVDKHGKALMPTTRYRHVRKLLKSGKAVAICNKPFTIRLKYESSTYTQDLWEGIDSGCLQAVHNYQADEYLRKIAE